MVNNKHGGKHKHLARKHNTEEKTFNTRMKKDSMEHYGFVEKNLGNGHFDVLCDDDVLRRCRLPGAFKKKKRDNYVAVKGFVLIGKYDFETVVEGRIEKCDLLETYSDMDMKIIMEHARNDNALSRFLESRSTGDTSSKSGCCAMDTGGVIFADDADDDIIKKVAAAAAAAASGDISFENTKIVGYQTEINIDEI